MRLLWLTPELPYWPGGSGGSTRQFQLIRRLRERGHEVTVVAPVHPSQREGPEALRATGATLLAVERPGRRASEVAHAIGRRPSLALELMRRPLVAWQVEVFWTALRPLALRALAEAERPDVVLVEHDWAARWADDLPAEVPRVLGLENLSWGYYEARAHSASGAARALLSLEARRFRRHDRAALGAYDLLLAVSDTDRVSVATVSDVRTEVIPNGVDTTTLRPAPAPDAPALLFTGTMSYPPNAEALIWLLREIWPRVRDAVPDARLLVVGRDAPDEARRLADPHVEIAGWVPDMAPWFARASVVLVPILSGGGTRLKVLDGLASGRPVVSTAMGAEGIAMDDGAHAVIADDAETFARAAIRLLAEPERAARIGAAGRRLAEERYDWRTIGDRLEALLAELVRGGSARARS
jgi:glycosyltransferase involved in cell wall biosynthesis